MMQMESAHAFQLHCHLKELVQGVDRARGVADARLHICSDALGDGHRPFHVPYIVQGIKDPKNVYAIGLGTNDKAFDDVIGVVFIAESKVAPPHISAGW